MDRIVILSKIPRGGAVVKAGQIPSDSLNRSGSDAVSLNLGMLLEVMSVLLYK